MHNRALHDSLAAFVEEAAWQLAAEVSGGAEVPFELIEQGRSTAPLYCYRPLTAAFIADRVGELGKLPSYPSARAQLAALGGLEDYLRRRGVHHVPEPASARGDAALQAFLTAVWSDATDFVFEPQRFRQAFAELEESVYEDVSLTQVLACVDGLVMESDRVELGDGLSLVRAGSLGDAPDELHLDSWATVASVRVEGARDEHDVLQAAGRRLRRLQTALRLWDDAEPAVGLERAAVAGLVRPEPQVEALVASLGACVRAVLRDVLCGHLDPDLRRVADDLLAREPASA